MNIKFLKYFCLLPSAFRRRQGYGGQVCLPWLSSSRLSFLKYFCLLPSAFRRRQGYGGQVCLPWLSSSRLSFLKYFCLLPSAFCLLLLSGCEWTTGGGMTVGDENVTAYDFSGTYKASDGGVLVRKPGTSGTTTNTTYTTNSVGGEVLATGDGSSTAFAGALAHPTTLLKGTLTIVVGGYRCSDPGTASAGTVALTISPSDGTTGTINLNTGAWVLNFASPIASGTQLIAAYQYVSSSSVVTSNQGNHGNPIYSFVLYQQGNNVQIIDDCASKYEGNIGSSSVSNSMVQLYVTGYSQGYNVTIAGTLNAASYTMTATFIEDGGYDADISGLRQ